MSSGTIIVDLASEQGGNCELTESNKTIIKYGVTIIAPSNLATTVPYHASQMFSNNITNFLLNLTNQGKAVPGKFNYDDAIIRGTMITRGGQIIHPVIQKLLQQKHIRQSGIGGNN
jgi:NAD(P) transhydrogenase subunit alpha